MSEWRRTKLWVLGLFMTLAGLSQDIPIGSWCYHLSYQRARLVAGSAEVMFCAAENGLFSVRDGATQIISKNDGLSNVAPGAMAFDPVTRSLIIGYDDSVIDFVSEDGVEVIDDLKGLDFGVPKAINSITVSGETAFAATDFGIVSMDIEERRLLQIFTEIGPGGARVPVTDIVIQSDTVYALSNQGVLLGALEDNLLDFNNWSLIESPFLEGLESFDGQVLTFREDRLFALNRSNLTLEALLDVPYDITDMDAQDQSLYLLGESSLSVWDGETIDPIPTELLQEAVGVVAISEVLWIADGQSGLIRKLGALEETIIPAGPFSDGMTHIKHEEALYAFYAPDPGGGEADSSGYSVFSEGVWVNDEVEGFYNISDVGSLNDRILLSSNGSGVYDLTNEEVLDMGLPDSVDVPALLTRGDGTWALIFGQADALIFLQQEGGILRFDSSTVGTNRATFLQQSQAGSVWLTRKNSSTGIYVYNPIEELRRRITLDDQLPSNIINGIALDLEDESWIATARGPVFFPDASFVFDEFDAIAPIFENDILLEDENITAIAVDGGNRKWMGTNDGIWVFSRNVDELDLRFTAENSPLLSNQIREFAYDPASGEMFILTSRGLCSYQTGSSAGGLTHSNVSIFPNPVYPHDVGPVTLKGLAQNAIVKVTDVNGRLVSETEALGGTATWDLRDVNGAVVVGGVYLLFSSTADGEDTFVGKVAVIR